jgi:hypothetical protein
MKTDVGRVGSMLSRLTVTLIGAFDEVSWSVPEVLKVPEMPALEVWRTRSGDLRDLARRVSHWLAAQNRTRTSTVMSPLKVESRAWPAARDCMQNRSVMITIRRGMNVFSDLDVDGSVRGPKYGRSEIAGFLEIPDIQREIREVCDNAFQLQWRFCLGKNDVDFDQTPETHP